MINYLCYKLFSVYIHVQMWNIHAAHKNEPRKKASSPNYRYFVMLTYVYYCMNGFIVLYMEYLIYQFIENRSVTLEQFYWRIRFRGTEKPVVKPVLADRSRSTSSRRSWTGSRKWTTRGRRRRPRPPGGDRSGSRWCRWLPPPPPPTPSPPPGSWGGSPITRQAVSCTGYTSSHGPNIYKDTKL
jgi:hypothetical protein